MHDEPTQRLIARGVLLARAAPVSILLFELEDGRWALPGGELESGESHADALTRELREELDLDFRNMVGPLLWTREHQYVRDGRPVIFEERHFLIELPGIIQVRQGRWFEVGELDLVPCAPPRLPELVSALVEQGPPKTLQLIRE